MYKFSGKLVFDGKYIRVKGYQKKIPMIWGIDYDTHDLPHFMLVPSENYQACLRYFGDLKRLGYPLKYLVCDDNERIKEACRDVFPHVFIQTCWRHYLDNIRRDLNTKSCDKYKAFEMDIRYIYENRLARVEFEWYIQDIYPIYKEDPRTLFWLSDLMYRKVELTNYHQLQNAPNTTNLIEGYNSHLEQRLNTTKGFEKYLTAKIWLNAYVIKRRLDVFTDCSKKFKYLNGICSLQKTIKNTKGLPKLF